MHLFDIIDDFSIFDLASMIVGHIEHYRVKKKKIQNKELATATKAKVYLVI